MDKWTLIITIFFTGNIKGIIYHFPLLKKEAERKRWRNIDPKKVNLIIKDDLVEIDWICGDIPSKDDEIVIMFAEAAFTGELLNEFKHTNTAGDHVSNGIREKGYKCKKEYDLRYLVQRKPYSWLKFMKDPS